jgi:hypothetical protein
MNIIGIKLINGDEVIGRVTAVNSGSLAVDDLAVDTPRIIGLQETQQGMGLGFMPWTLGNPDATVVITRKDIACTYTPKAEIEKAYLSQTSKIQLMG